MFQKISLVLIGTITTWIVSTDISYAKGKSAVTEFDNGNFAGRKVRVNLPALPANSKNKYTWIKIQYKINPTTTLSVPLKPMNVPPGQQNGGSIEFKPSIPVPADATIQVLSSYKLDSESLRPNSVDFFDDPEDTEPDFTDDTPTPLTSLKEGNSFIVSLDNLTASTISVTDFKIFQNVDTEDYLSALEMDGPIPEDLYMDPINVLGSGEMVSDVMSDFILDPGNSLDFLLGTDFDPETVVLTSGFCNGKECSTGLMIVPVPEPTSGSALLALGVLGAGSAFLGNKKQ